MGQPKFTDQALERVGFLERIEVLALYVFNEGHGHGRFIGHLPDNGWDLGEACELRSPPATLPGDDFVALLSAPTPDRPHQNGLDDPLLADRFGQFVQCLRAQVGARLVSAALQKLDGEASQLLAACQRAAGRSGRVRPRLSQQVGQAAPQGRFF